MEVIYSKEDYNRLQKELCFAMNDLKQLTDYLCSDFTWNDYSNHATSSATASILCDKIKNYLVTMNLMSFYVAKGGQDEREDFSDYNSSAISDKSGDNLELLDVEETSQGNV